MRKIRFLPGADLDYFESEVWYHSRSPRAARGFETAVDVAIKRIAQSPEHWPFCDDVHQYYVLRKYPFSIVYRATDEELIIVAVAHSSRDASYWHRRD